MIKLYEIHFSTWQVQSALSLAVELNIITQAGFKASSSWCQTWFFFHIVFKTCHSVKMENLRRRSTDATRNWMIGWRKGWMLKVYGALERFWIRSVKVSWHHPVKSWESSPRWVFFKWPPCGLISWTKSDGAVTLQRPEPWTTSKLAFTDLPDLRPYDAWKHGIMKRDNGIRWNFQGIQKALLQVIASNGRASATPLNSLHLVDGGWWQSRSCHDPKWSMWSQRDFFVEKSPLHFCCISVLSPMEFCFIPIFLSIDFQRPRKKHGSFCTWGLDHQGLGRVSWHDFEYLEKLCDTSSCAKANFEVYQAAGKCRVSTWIYELLLWAILSYYPPYN